MSVMQFWRSGGALAARLLSLLGLLAFSGPSFPQGCGFRHAITFADGSKACLTDYAIAGRNVPGHIGRVATLVPNSVAYTLAASPALASCPQALAFFSTPFLSNQTMPQQDTTVGRRERARSECARQLPAGSPTSCGCKILVEDGSALLTRVEFERYASALPAHPAAAEALSAGVAARAEPERVVEGTRPTPALPPAAAAPAAATGPELAEMRRQIERLQAQVDQAQQQRPAVVAAPGRQSARALVIGNGAYKHLGVLANPRRDASDFAAKLRGFGIEVDLVLDADRNALVRALADHQRRANALDVNILYYAGHGVQVGGINYIVPVDMLADGISAGYVKLNGVALNDALEYLPARTRLVFLDACRDNPAARSLVSTRSVAAPGLAPMAVTSGTLISYATRDGSVAEDGRGRNSPYTTALLQHLDAPDDIAVVLRRVRQSVMRMTANRQEPWEYGSLVGDQLILPRLTR